MFVLFGRNRRMNPKCPIFDATALTTWARNAVSFVYLVLLASQQTLEHFVNTTHRIIAAQTLKGNPIALTPRPWNV